MTQQKRSTSTKRKRTSTSKTKKKKNALTWAERSFGHNYKRVFWIGLLLAAGVYLFVTYHYIVAPTSNLWQGLFGSTKYPDEYSVRGIDISRYQSEINWEKVAAAKIDKQPIRFVIAKATEGKEHVDKNFNDNFYQIGQYDFIRGAYHFFSPKVSGDEQAKHYLKQVHLEPGDLAPVLDVETSGSLSPEQLRREVAEWLNIVEKHYHHSHHLHWTEVQREISQLSLLQPLPLLDSALLCEKVVLPRKMEILAIHRPWQGKWYFWKCGPQCL